MRKEIGITPPSSVDDITDVPTDVASNISEDEAGADLNLTGFDVTEEEQYPVKELDESAPEELDADKPAPDDISTPDPYLQDIEAVRALIHALHPSIVPELIAGDTVSALIASIKPAEEAYNRIVSGIRIPAGGNAPVTIDADAIPTFDKIRRGLSAHAQKGR